MEFQAFHILVASMFCNFIVLGISINRPDSFYPVSLSAISISLQGLALKHFAIISVTWIIYPANEAFYRAKTCWDRKESVVLLIRFIKPRQAKINLGHV